jgi:hypothetical protein
MKARKFGLLAFTTIALAMPLAASAEYANIEVDDADLNPILTDSYTGTSYTIADALKNNYSVSTDFGGFGNGSYTYSTVFTVDPTINSFTAVLNFYDPTKSAFGTLSGPGVSGGFDGSQYVYTGLVGGKTYTWESNFTVKDATPGNLGGLQNSLTLSIAVVPVPPPIPEPEEWAMMLVGAGLVGFQVRRKQRALRNAIVG